MKFIQASDLHIDSPLRGLDKYEDAPADMIRSATRDAFENLVDLAIDERVEFVILSGDLADGDWKNTQTMLWLNGQFRRLEEDGIQGNLIPSRIPRADMPFTARAIPLGK